MSYDGLKIPGGIITDFTGFMVNRYRERGNTLHCGPLLRGNRSSGYRIHRVISEIPVPAGYNHTINPISSG
ncbi:hypothetical protein [Nitrosomonas oligotropha]|uniref:hypothetical protein n=1 Tax=Nitrosomonas oligotropha TaxID=42354 RepID=UPI00136AC617|nr:hypothetical protein [Nitrosomonas oligotropha]